MGTLITNDELGINFEVKELLQKDLEIYEHGMSLYLHESEYSTNRSGAVLSSAVVFGAIESKLIPEDVIKDKDELRNSKPRKISFLSARFAEILTAAREEEVGLDIDIPEITQGELEKYEKVRNKVLAGQEIDMYEMALTNSIMVQIGIKLGWIPEKVLSSKDDIDKSKPNLIRYLANNITTALSEARSVSGE